MVVTITPDGVRRPMATTILTFILALPHRLAGEGRQTRAGDGFARRLDYMGYGLTGKLSARSGLATSARSFSGWPSRWT